MLQLLRLKNIAIVSELELEFSNGLNVITGETGSGKSLILRGLELLRGGRSSSDLLRAGAEKGEVEALFVLTEEARERTLADLRTEFEWADEIFSEEEIVLRRVIDANGRGKIFINSRLGTRAELETVASALFDITGQHSQQRLLDEKFHRQCLDQFGVPKDLLEEVREAFEKWSELAKRHDRMMEESSVTQERLRRLSFERDELKEAGLQSGEKQEVEAELKRASAAEALSAGISETLSVLDDGVEKTLTRLESTLLKLSRLDGGLSALVNISGDINVQVSELRLGLDRYAASLEIDPDKLEELRERLSELAKIERKYNRPAEDLLKYYEEISKELELFESGAFDLEKLRKEMAKAKDELTVLEKKLTEARTVAAQKLSSAVESGLVELEMKRAKFAVKLSPGRSTESGSDVVEFQITANPGEPFQSLAEVASGGELSRVLLVLKTLLNEQTTPVLQVFDEIDVGVGGATAQIVGEKLKSLTPRFQVICVTHAPQIAALGQRHLVISKESTDSSTEVVVKDLQKDERIMEIARMLAGREVTEQFIKSAKVLLRG